MNLTPVPAIPSDTSLALIETSIRHLLPGCGYTARDLHAFYAELCREAGAEPVTPNLYGRRLRRLGCTATRDTTGSRRVWRLPAA